MYFSECFENHYFAKNFQNIIDAMPESEVKNYLNLRYIRIMRLIEKNSKRSAFWYYSLSVIVTVGSILVPALISVKDNVNTDLSWSLWSISVSVSVSNAIMKMFSLDKTYITRNLRLNQFKSEGSYFISKSGVYANIEDEKERFKLFVSNVEKIKRQQVLEEYTQRQEDDILNSGREQPSVPKNNGKPPAAKTGEEPIIVIDSPV